MKKFMLAAIAAAATLVMANVESAEASCTVVHTDPSSSTVTKNLNRPRSFKVSNNKHPHWDLGSGTYAPMNAWEMEGVANHIQKYLTFTILNKPAKANVRQIAFFVAGQEVCYGQHQIVTGTDDNWRHKIDQANGNDNWKSYDTKIDKRSAAWIFMDGLNKPHSYNQDLRVFDLATTLVIDITDASFAYPGLLSTTVGQLGNCNTGNSFSNNNQVIKGWKRWLDANVDWNNIKAFFGAGWSRGGCFVTRLADYLFKNSSTLRCNAKIILETFDPVCHPDEWASDVKEGTAVDNPFNSSYKCRKFKAAKLFGDTPRQNIRWRSTIGGDSVAVIARAMCDENTDSSNQYVQIKDSGTVVKSGAVSSQGNAAIPACNDCWYEQNFINRSHGYIGAQFSHDNVGSVSCTGQSKCGYGSNAACIPGPRADQDAIHKHMSHAARWGALSVNAFNPNRFNYNCNNPDPFVGTKRTWVPAPIDLGKLDLDYNSGVVVANPISEVDEEPWADLPFWQQYWTATAAKTVEDFVLKTDTGLISTPYTEVRAVA